jgi:hypothetical protein
MAAAALGTSCMSMNNSLQAVLQIKGMTIPNLLTCDKHDRPGSADRWYGQRKLCMNYQRLKKMDAKAKRVKRAISVLITDENRKKLGGFLKNRSRTKMVRKAGRQTQAHLNDILHTCLQHIAPVTAPLALISQVRYSGGSLLNTLFDGHPEIYAHPHALTIGYPHKHLWPNLDPDDKPQRWFEILFEETVIEQIRAGCQQFEKHALPLPFVFLPLLQKKIFLAYLKSLKAIKPGDVFDAYMTAYFGAWLNYRNQGHPKKFVTAFSPQLAMVKENVEYFFEVYPNGKIISPVRDPGDWFFSVSGSESKMFGDARSALNAWGKGTRAMLWNKRRFGDRVCLIKFEDLVSRTEAVMRYLAEFLMIRFDDILLTPTFNGIPIAASNSCEMGIADEMTPPSEADLSIDEDKLDLIKEMTADNYQLVLSEAVTF